jgi:transposase
VNASPPGAHEEVAHGQHPWLPERITIVDLPPYNPELNPCEQHWDLIKDEIENWVFETVGQLRGSGNIKGLSQRV